MADFPKESIFKLRIDGPHGDEAEQELSSLIEKEFCIKPTRVAEQKLNSETHKVADPISVAALVLSVPAAIVAVVDLIERVKKKKAADRLIQWAQDYHEKNPDTTITITTPEGISCELRKAETVDILDAAPKESS